MSTEIAVQQQAPTGLEIATFTDAEKMALRFAQSSLIPADLKDKPADIVVILITGRELGLSPMQSLRGLHVVKGRPVLAAEMIVALIKRSPACRHFRMVESTDQVATYEALREGEPEPTRLSYTIEQAQKAGLTGNNTYKAHPAAMLRARCSAALGRIVFPDVMLGLLEESEADETRAPVHAAPVVHAAPPPPADITDAELVEDTEADWLQRIADAADEAALRTIGAKLAAAYPDGHPIRAAVKGAYAARQKELRA